jgi:hypothetical protein
MQAVSTSPDTFRGMMYQTPSTRYMFEKPNRLKALPLVTVSPSLNWKPRIGTVGAGCKVSPLLPTISCGGLWGEKFSC